MPKQNENPPQQLIVDVEPTKMTMPYDRKIVSWNVAGFKACLKKGFENYLKVEDADIICLQETKCRELPQFSNAQGSLKVTPKNYNYYWLTNKKVGYAGVSVWTKKAPKSVNYGISPDDKDEGRVITLEFEDYYLVNTYVPNSGEKLVNLDFRREWNTKFRLYLCSLDNRKPVLLCGDLNVAHHPIDLTNPDRNLRSAGFTVEERDDFTSLLEKGFVDSFRTLYPTRDNTYTYWSYRFSCRAKNIGWRLDYFVASQRYMNKIVDCVPRADVGGSDHCPLVLFLKT